MSLVARGAASNFLHLANHLKTPHKTNQLATPQPTIAHSQHHNVAMASNDAWGKQLNAASFAVCANRLVESLHITIHPSWDVGVAFVKAFMQAVEDERPIAKVLYLQGTRLENMVLQERLTQAGVASRLPENQLVVGQANLMAFSALDKLLVKTEGSCVAKDTVYMMDSEACCTMAGTFATARLVQHVKALAERHEEVYHGRWALTPLGIIFVDFGVIARSVAANRSALCEHKVKIVIEMPQLVDDSRFVPPDMVDHIHNRTTATLLGGKHVVVFEAQAAAARRARSLRVPHLHIDKHTSLDALHAHRPASVISIAPGQFSNPLPLSGVGLVISSAPKFPCIDLESGSIVTRGYTTHHEALCQQAYGEDLVCTYNRADVQMEPLPRTMCINIDIRWFALQLQAMKGTTRALSRDTLPLSIDDTFTLHEHLRRLQCMGMVERDVRKKDGFDYDLVMAGRRLVRAHNKAPSLAGNFKAASLVAGITKSIPPRVMRILIRMAVMAANVDAILSMDTDRCFTDLVPLCNGPSKDLVSRGYLWLLWGVWEHGFELKTLRGYTVVHPSEVEVVEGATLNTTACFGAMKEVSALEEVFQLPGQSQKQWSDDLRQGLGADEITTIEESIFRAWLFDLVMIPKKGHPVQSSGSKVELRAPEFAYDTTRNDAELSPARYPRWVGAMDRLEAQGGSLIASRITLLPTLLIGAFMIGAKMTGAQI
ncbi:hypothetical protein B0T19DRAFT_197580 [Cercophora scortea]|uniref:Uncharacterized protein n=1 Tax=Cercophora scortea TaxID=314031 RepID=A0AAE0IPE5_9PEZI|nr:hypothetical protein B0T19DRAFT_197580 [Cercophora scortea]